MFQFDKYLGTWYEQYTISQWFDIQGSSDVRAEYELNENGTISVTNTSVVNGKELSARGTATIKGPGELSVSFPRYKQTNETNYIVLCIMEHNEKYEISVVTDHEKTTLFVLTREKKISVKTELCILKVLEKNFDLSKVVRVMQN